MDEWLGVICAIGILLAIVTVVGHGLWLAMARLLKALGPDQSDQNCPVCNSAGSLIGRKCEKCGIDRSQSLHFPAVRSILAMARELPLLERERVISPATSYAILTHLNLRLQKYGAKTLPLPQLYPVVRPSTSDVAAEELRHEPAAASDGVEFVTSEDLQPSSEQLQPIIDRDLSDEPIVAELVSALPGIGADDFAQLSAPIPAASSAARNADQPVASVTFPQQPSRTIADVLQSFMEESNIRWVELISGTVIVVCAIGLVISLRATLQDTIPYFPALMFMLVTAGIHFAGIYSLRKWNLKTTSRGVLIVGSLLVPLNFLAAVFLSGEHEAKRSATDPVYLSAIVIGLVAFGSMSYFASRSLVTRGWGTLILGVVGPSLSQLFVNRAAPELHSLIDVCGLLLVPIVCAITPLVHQLMLLSNRRQLARRLVFESFLKLGLSGFSLLAVLALFAVRSGNFDVALGQATPLLSLAAAAVLAVGIRLHHGVQARNLVNYRTAGSTIAVLGGAILIACVVLAWPAPSTLVSVGVINAVVLVGMAIGGRLPVLVTPALICAALATVIGQIWLGGYLPADNNQSVLLLQQLTMARTSVTLSLLAVVVAGIGVAQLKFRQRDIAWHCFLSVGIITAASVFVLLVAGFWRITDDRWLVAPILGLYALSCCVVGRWVRHVAVGWCGSSLAGVAVCHALLHNPEVRGWFAEIPAIIDRPYPATLVAFSALGSVVTLLASRYRHGERSYFEAVGRPWGTMSLAASVLAIPMLLVVRQQAFLEHGTQMGLVAMCWLFVALGFRSPLVMSGAQIASTLSASLFCTAACQRMDWWDGKWLSGTHLNWQLVALGLWNCCWAIIRLTTTRIAAIQNLLQTRWPSVDYWLFYRFSSVSLLLALRSVWLGWDCEISGAAWPTAHHHWYSDLTGGVGWLAFAVCVAGLLLAIWERRSLKPFASLVALTAVVPLLGAAYFAPDRAVASGLRWGLAIYVLIWMVPILIRNRIGLLFPQWQWKVSRLEMLVVPNAIRIPSLRLGGILVIMLSSAAIVQGVGQVATGGPLADSIWSKLSPPVSYAIPLCGLVLALSIYAIRDSIPGLMACAAVLFQYTVSAIVIFARIESGRRLDGSTLITALIWNAIGFGVFSAIWLSVLRWVEPRKVPRNAQYLPIFLGGMVVLHLLIACWCGVLVIGTPGYRGTMEAALGQWEQHLGTLLALGTLLWAVRLERIIGKSSPEQIGAAQTDRERRRVHWISGAALCLTLSIAASLDRLDVARHWFAYHWLEVSWLAIATGVLATCIWRRVTLATTSDSRLPASTYVGWSNGLIASVTLMAIFRTAADPAEPWWSFGSLLAATLLLGIWAILEQRTRFVIGTLVTSPLVTATWLIYYRNTPSQLLAPLQLELITLLLVAAFWMAWQVVVVIRDRNVEAVSRTIRSVPWVTWGAVIATLLIYVLGPIADAQIRISNSAPLGLAGARGLALIVALAIYCLLAQWSNQRSGILVQLYLAGFAVIGWMVSQWQLSVHQTILALELGAAIYGALIAWVWYRGTGVVATATMLRIPNPISRLQHTERWLPAVTLILYAVNVCYAAAAVLLLEIRTERMLAASIPFCAACAFGLMAQRDRRPLFQGLTLIVAVVGAVLSSWADMAPSLVGLEVLDRCVRMLIVFVASTILYGAVIPRLLAMDNDWRVRLWQAAKALAIGSASMLLVVLGIEVVLFEPGIGTPIGTGSLLAVSFVCVGLVIALLVTAGSDQKFPGLSDSMRMGCVYAAQMVAVLLFAHIYLARHVWFHGLLRPWWPYILMGIAYGGVGAGEILRRRNLRIFAEPMARSGTFLPLLPAIAMWFVPHDGTNSLVLLVAGLMYAAVSFMRKSLLAGIAAGVAGNGALWAMLADLDGFHFNEHPQFWLIPPAICALVGAHLNRHRLSTDQLAAFRYGCMIVVYLSSTSEVFFVGVGNSIWAPIILAILSMLGVAAGIALRIRAFLYMGTAFVFLSVFSMVWNAYQHIQHVGIWWAFGIATGVGVLALYGLFELKKQQIQAMIERLRQWEQ